MCVNSLIKKYLEGLSDIVRRISVMHQNLVFQELLKFILIKKWYLFYNATPEMFVFSFRAGKLENVFESICHECPAFVSKL